jgi:phytoene synthase
MPLPISDNDLERCKKLHKKHGKNYYFATRFFPEDTRHATHALYAFFRMADEIVDNPKEHGVDNPGEAITSWKRDWEKAYNEGVSEDPVLRATAAVFHEFDIPFIYSEAFLWAMEQDLHKERYETYEDLKAYMYGSAATVGLMMSYVIGFSEKRALVYAETLGYAMQLTNFLRDIEEDYVERNRIYIPREELAAFDIGEEDIANQQFSDRFGAFMRFQIRRCRTMYKFSEAGIPMLEKPGRFPVYLARLVYAAILDKLEDQGRNPFVGRASTNLLEKGKLLAKAKMKSYE